MTAVPENYFARGVRLLEHFGDEGYVKVLVDGGSAHFSEFRDLGRTKEAGTLPGVFGCASVQVECERQVRMGSQAVSGVFLITFVGDE